MGKKDKKKKGDGMAKTLEKTAKKELKNLKKEFGEDDIDQLLSEIKKKDEQQVAIAIQPCESPTPRSGASWLAHPSKPELLLFGGELYNGQTTSVYNDLFIYNIQKKDWKKVTSAQCPPPRSAHQAVIIDKPEAPEMWIFGGEFTSPSGNQFHHYRDLWMLNLSTYAWELKAGGEKSSGKKSSSSSSSGGAASGPSARSGHRMVVYKHKLLVFGGFFDSGYETRYFNDMHAWDMETMAWLPQINFNSALAPGPRSGFGFFVNEQSDTAYIYGGFAMETKKKEAPKAAPGKKVSKSAGQATQIPVAYSDFWSLNLVNSSWTQVKKRGYFPAAGRSSMGFAAQKEKSRVFVFGGVKDDATSSSATKKRRSDDSDDELGDTTSTNYNDLFCFDMHKDRQRWYFVDYKGDKSDKVSGYEVSVKVKSKPKDGAASSDKKEDDADEDGGATGGETSIFDFNPVLDALPTIPSSSTTAADSSSTSSLSLSPSVSAPVPAPRRSSLLCLKGSHLYLYGGVMETPNSDVEHTFGDIWALDVNKGNAAWELIMKPQEEVEWAGSEDEGGEEDEEEEEEQKGGDKKKKKKQVDSDDEDEDEDEDEDDSSDDEEDEQKTSSSSSASGPNLKPSVGESLTVYFARTKQHWMTVAGPALEQDKIDAAKAAIEAQKQAELEAKERAEAEAALAAEAASLEAQAGADVENAPATGENELAPIPDTATPATTASTTTDPAPEKEKKKKSKEKEKDVKKAEKEKEKEAKKDAKKEKKGEKISYSLDATSSSSSSTTASSNYEKELRTKAFEMASARFQQR